MDDLLVVRLEVDRRSRPTTDSPVVHRAPAKHIGSQRKKGCRGYYEGRRRETGVATPNPFLKNILMARAPPETAPGLSSGGFFDPRPKKSRHKRCGVQDPGRGTEPLMRCESWRTHARQRRRGGDK